MDSTLHPVPQDEQGLERAIKDAVRLAAI